MEITILEGDLLVAVEGKEYGFENKSDAIAFAACVEARGVESINECLELHNGWKIEPPKPRQPKLLMHRNQAQNCNTF